MERRRAGRPEPVEDAGDDEFTMVREPEAGLPEYFGAHLAFVLRIAGGIGVVLVVIGSVIAVVTQRNLPTTTIQFETLPGSLLTLDPGAILTLGIMMFVAGPVFGVGYLALAFLRIHDRLYALISAVVLLILMSSILITLEFRGA